MDAFPCPNKRILFSGRELVCVFWPKKFLKSHYSLLRPSGPTQRQMNTGPRRIGSRYMYHAVLGT